MDKSDDMVSSESKSKSSQKVTKLRIRNCQRCKEHGELVAIKNHKKDCPYRFCLCHRCISVGLRQHCMKVATAVRRERIRQSEKERDREMMGAASISSPNGYSNHSNSSDAQALTDSSEVSDRVQKFFATEPLSHISTLPTSTSPYKIMNPDLLKAQFPDFQKVDKIESSCEKICQKLGFPIEFATAIYIYLKDTGVDDETYMFRYISGNKERRKEIEYKASKLGPPHQGYPYISTLGNPTYYGNVPSIVAEPTISSFAHTLEAQRYIMAKAQSVFNPVSPPERPSSYAEPSLMRPFFKIKDENAD